MWPFWTTLRAILFSIFSTLKPGVVLFSTMKPLTWLSARSRAQIIEMSHHGALPIGRDRRVDACHLHGNQTGQQSATASAAVAFQASAADVEFLNGRQQFERKCVFDPILRDDRRNLRLHECPHLRIGRPDNDGEA